MRKIISRIPPVYGIAALCSIAISLWIYLCRDVLNPDAICYLESAAVYQLAGLKAAFNLCSQARWPFYSVLIAWTHQFTHLSFENSAYLLDSFFSLVIVLTFVRLVAQMQAHKAMVALAAVTILVFNSFNGLRDYIIRDHGFWALWMLSVLCYFHFLKTRSWRAALVWSCCSIGAILFRVEGLVFYLLAPLFIWFYPALALKQRVQAFFRLTLPLLVFAVGWMLAQPGHIMMAPVGRLHYQVEHFFDLIISTLHRGMAGLRDSVFYPDRGEDFLWKYVQATLVWYVMGIISALGITYAFLIAYVWYKRLAKMDSALFFTLITYLVISVLITGVYYFEGLYLSKRYIMMLLLLLSLFVPLAMHDIFYVQKKQWLTWVIGILLVGTFIGGIVNFGFSKKYLFYAGSWLKNEVPAGEKIYSNDLLVVYYAQHYGHDFFQVWDQFMQTPILERNNWKKYQYVAMRVNHADADMSQKIAASVRQKPIKTFANRRGDQVMIFKVS
jgi:hypothetical protein